MFVIVFVFVLVFVFVYSFSNHLRLHLSPYSWPSTCLSPPSSPATCVCVWAVEHRTSGNGGQKIFSFKSFCSRGCRWRGEGWAPKPIQSPGGKREDAFFSSPLLKRQSTTRVYHWVGQTPGVLRPGISKSEEYPATDDESQQLQLEGRRPADMRTNRFADTSSPQPAFILGAMPSCHGTLAIATSQKQSPSQVILRRNALLYSSTLPRELFYKWPCFYVHNAHVNFRSVPTVCE